VNRSADFYPYTGVSPAEAAINSDRAIAKKLTGVWLPFQESSALRWPAPSNYRLNREDIQNPDIQNPRSDPRRIGYRKARET